MKIVDKMTLTVEDNKEIIGSMADDMVKGKITLEQFHNKKGYAKRVGNFSDIIICTVAFELYNFIKKGQVCG
tara:strand:+ start:252 stop:467 length:216 start_codon:yes stop_codon:yes gene_type:complete